MTRGLYERTSLAVVLALSITGEDGCHDDPGICIQLAERLPLQGQIQLWVTHRNKVTDTLRSHTVTPLGWRYNETSCWILAAARWRYTDGHDSINEIWHKFFKNIMTYISISSTGLPTLTHLCDSHTVRLSRTREDHAVTFTDHHPHFPMKPVLTDAASVNLGSCNPLARPATRSLKSGPPSTCPCCIEWYKHHISQKDHNQSIPINTQPVPAQRPLGSQRSGKRPGPATRLLLYLLLSISEGLLTSPTSHLRARAASPKLSCIHLFQRPDLPFFHLTDCRLSYII